jgi:starvation-inducible outer membrane lipoprotein
MRIALLALALALAACATPPPDRRIGSGEPDWGAISHRIR